MRLGHCHRERDLSAPCDILVAKIISLATSSASGIFVVCHLASSPSISSASIVSLGHCHRERNLSAPCDILVAKIISLATSSASAIFIVCHLASSPSISSASIASLGHRHREHDLSAPSDILVARIISLATSSANAIFVVCHLLSSRQHRHRCCRHQRRRCCCHHHTRLIVVLFHIHRIF